MACLFAFLGMCSLVYFCFFSSLLSSYAPSEYQNSQQLVYKQDLGSHSLIEERTLKFWIVLWIWWRRKWVKVESFTSHSLLEEWTLKFWFECFFRSSRLEYAVCFCSNEQVRVRVWANHALTFYVCCCHVRICLGIHRNSSFNLLSL